MDDTTTPDEGRPWTALCDYCHWCMPEVEYQAAEAAAGDREDPRCPRPGCGRSIWSFHQL